MKVGLLSAVDVEWLGIDYLMTLINERKKITITDGGSLRRIL